MKTITKIILFATFALCSQISMAQKPVEIIGVPENSYGFLVWKTDPSSVAYSICTLMQHNVVGSDTISSIVSRYEIWDRNYFEVPEQYWKNTQGTTAFSADVTGYNSNHLIVDNDDVAFGPDGGFGSEILCPNTTCLSSNYAYRIKVVQVGGQYTYTQDYAYASISDEGMQVPYYRWFTPAEFGLYTGLLGGGNPQGQGNPRFHGFAQWLGNEPGMINPQTGIGTNATNSIIVVQNNGSSTYCDNNGSEIVTSTVYGIRKTLWHWWENPYRVELSATNHCAQGTFSNVQGYINFMNQNTTNTTDGDNRPPLACIALNTGNNNCGNTGGGGDDDDDDDDGGVFVACKVVRVWVETDDPSSGGGYYTFEINCDGAGTGLNGSADVTLGEYLANSELFNITSLTRNPQTLINMTGTDFLDANGAPVLPSITLEPGLHRLTVKMPNQHLYYLVFETTQTESFSIAHKDYFQALIYPNPNTEGYYFINMESAAHLKPNYQVFDALGTKIWEQDFDLPEGHEETHRIQPSSNFPNGLILHKFTFQDGSYESITTLKQ